ncbi:MAG: hypothetical protein R3E08_02470 [Thiotrichaceae bacterium]
MREFLDDYCGQMAITADKTVSVKLYDNTTFNGNRTLKLLLTNAEAASLEAPSEAV